jgi:hypothetical protein
MNTGQNPKPCIIRQVMKAKTLNKSGEIKNTTVVQTCVKIHADRIPLRVSEIKVANNGLSGEWSK